MTVRPHGAGAPPSLGRRPRFKPLIAAAVIASPVLALALANAVTLLRALVDATSTCWMKAATDAGVKFLFPFEFYSLIFAGTAQYWAPIILLAITLFWYLEWIRLREIGALAVACVAVLYLVGVESGWMLDLYRHRYLAACG